MSKDEARHLDDKVATVGVGLNPNAFSMWPLNWETSHRDVHGHPNIPRKERLTPNTDKKKHRQTHSCKGSTRNINITYMYRFALNWRRKCRPATAQCSKLTPSHTYSWPHKTVVAVERAAGRVRWFDDPLFRQTFSRLFRRGAHALHTDADSYWATQSIDFSIT